MKQSKKHRIEIKRIYLPNEEQDGYRILVDRLWPRGIKKEDGRMDAWKKELAPSNEIRKQFNHQEENYDAFVKNYKKELDQNEAVQEFADSCKKMLKDQNVTLLYSAKDEAHTTAVVLREWINKKITGE